MKILSSEQTRMLDAYTVENEPIKSIDLMERAAAQLFRQWIRIFPKSYSVDIYAGPGNNGGDGIALTRMLTGKGYLVNLIILKTDRGLSKDAEINFNRLKQNDKLKIIWLTEYNLKDQIPAPKAVIVDAIFGSGLTKPLEGFFKQVVRHINAFPNIKVSIDIPSGLFAESNPDIKSATIIRADYTWCFQFPKLAFMMPENELYVGDWKYLDIGLHKGFMESLNAPNNFITSETVVSMIHHRNKFSHKGNYGHALLFAGASGKMGAAIMASRACLRSGAGLLTTHIPLSGAVALNTAIPEAMLSLDKNENVLGSLPKLDYYSAVGAGPGIGTSAETAGVIEKLVENSIPMILDADALNIVAERQNLLEKLPHGTILTPHPGEYKRLFGADLNHFERLKRMQKLAAKYGIIIVLKGANTAIANIDGELWFNSTGNPGMATAGSGDVLTGIILSLLAQGYVSIEAAILGVYLHGLAGDLAAKEKGFEGLVASDIIERLPDAFISCKLK